MLPVKVGKLMFDITFGPIFVQDIDSQVSVNLMGTINAVYTFLSGMKSNSKGRICIISSVGGQIGLWGMSHYCATKFALKGLTEVSLAAVK